MRNDETTLPIEGRSPWPRPELLADDPAAGARRRSEGAEPRLEALAPGRLGRAKAAYTTRRVPLDALETLITAGVQPASGDLVLARVEQLRHHSRLETRAGRRAHLHVGDEIVVCYGDRYAPDQFEAEVPGDLGKCHLVAAGGIAATMLSRSRRVRAATEIRPLGLLADGDGRRANLGDWALPSPVPRRRPPTVAVAGTSMNAGKTSAAAAMIRGLVRSGLRVGAAKVTGTGAGGDYWKMKDAGAEPVFDFTDRGFASTYKVAAEKVEACLVDLVAHLALAGVDAVVLEVADGLFQRETAALLGSRAFATTVDAVLFAAGDSLGATAGLRWLEERSLPVAALTGMLTCSPLAVRETLDATSLPVLGLDSLSDPVVAARLLEPLAAFSGLEAIV